MLEENRKHKKLQHQRRVFYILVGGSDKINPRLPIHRSAAVNAFITDFRIKFEIYLYAAAFIVAVVLTVCVRTVRTMSVTAFPVCK